MSTIVVQSFMTLDGVVQGPGGRGEDPEGGFEYSGWQEGSDIRDMIQEWESRTEALLLGRKTYDSWSQAWAVWDEDAPGLVGELTRRYNRVPKYVASRTQTEFSWKNTSLLGPDAASVAAELRAQPGGELRVWGSTELIRTLADSDLIDEYRIVLYPIVLGTGKRLFSAGFPYSKLSLVESLTLPAGELVLTYRRADDDGPAKWSPGGA